MSPDWVSPTTTLRAADREDLSSTHEALGSIPRTKKKKKNHLIILDSRYMHREGEGRGHREKKGPYTGY
jgi:hypothetical protein